MTDTTKGNVLLVDDDKFLVDMYSMKFTAAGYQVQANLSVKDSLDALKAGFKPDAIVFDLTMPEQDGFSLLETLRTEKLAGDAALIALTNQNNDTERAKAESLGVDAYIIKASKIPSEVVSAVGDEITKKKGASTA